MCNAYVAALGVEISLFVSALWPRWPPPLERFVAPPPVRSDVMTMDGMFVDRGEVEYATLTRPVPDSGHRHPG